MKKAYIYINYNNIVVLKAYLEVVKNALEANGYKCEFVKSLEGINKKSLIVHPMAVDAFKYYWKGYKNFIVWQQGATADESYMRNHSKLRYWLLNKIDTFSMNKARFILYVSEYERKHYERIAGQSFAEKSYVMPCFNEEYDESVYTHKDYTKKVFTYVGSLDLWQCFEQTADLYKKIEDSIPNCQFKVLTFSVDEGKRILEQKGVKNFVVKCVPKEEVKKELIETTYGFILREDSIVNRVATPTKFSSYLASGVIPIFSDCLRDFSLASEGMRYVLKVPADYTLASITEFVNKDIEPQEIQKEYFEILNGHYSVPKHTKKLTELLSMLG